MSNVEYKPAEKLQIRLTRRDQSQSWGFRLQGGIDFSTPLSIQSVGPNSVSEQCGLRAGDAILAINNATSDAMTHEQAKMEILRSGDDINLLVERGAVKIWKPQVTPLNELRPAELNTIKTAIGDEVVPVQRTSLAANKSDDASNIGSSHNRTAQPFGGSKTAVPNVVHAQYNTPIGLYSADNLASSYNMQTQGIQKEMAHMDINDRPVGTQLSGTYQVLSQEEQSPYGTTYGGPAGASQAPGFRSVNAPIAKPPSERPQQPSMRCGLCDMLATGVIVRANGVPYHMACFKCTSCSMNLKQKGYFVVDGQLYCETHAKRKAQPPGSNMVATAVYR